MLCQPTQIHSPAHLNAQGAAASDDLNTNYDFTSFFAPGTNWAMQLKDGVLKTTPLPSTDTYIFILSLCDI